MRLGMAVDVKRCAACYACVVACKAEKGTPPGVFFRRVIKEEVGAYPRVRRTPFPLNCMHCADPPCVQVCPTGASTQRPDGVVEIDKMVCSGCRYCMMTCPYGNRYFYAKKRFYYPSGPVEYEELKYSTLEVGTTLKCDFCSERIEKGLEPACVANCPTKALTFGDLEDPESEVSRIIRDRAGYQLRAELGTDPSVFYVR